MKLPVQVNIAVRRQNGARRRSIGSGPLHCVERSHVKRGHTARLGDAHANDSTVFAAECDLQMRTHVLIVQRMILRELIEMPQKPVSKHFVQSLVDLVEVTSKRNTRGIEGRLIARFDVGDVVFKRWLPAVEAQRLPLASVFTEPSFSVFLSNLSQM